MLLTPFCTDHISPGLKACNFALGNQEAKECSVIKNRPKDRERLKEPELRAIDSNGIGIGVSIVIAAVAIDRSMGGKNILSVQKRPQKHIGNGETRRIQV